MEADTKSIQSTLQLLDPGTWDEKPKKDAEQPQDGKAKVLKLLKDYEAT